MSHLSHDTPAELRFAELRFLAFTPRDASSWLPFRRAELTAESGRSCFRRSSLRPCKSSAMGARTTLGSNSRPAESHDTSLNLPCSGEAMYTVLGALCGARWTEPVSSMHQWWWPSGITSSAGTNLLPIQFSASLEGKSCIFNAAGCL